MGYDYTGKVVGVTLKKAGYYKLEVWGAQGGEGAAQNTAYSNIGGYGGYTYGTVNVETNVVLYVAVGEAGKKGMKQKYFYAVGGYNGGGDGGKTIDTYGVGGSGGGGTDIRISSTSLYARIIVAGGGGGGGNTYNKEGSKYGGNGGGFNGGSGQLALDGKSVSTGGGQISGGVMGTSSNYNGIGLNGEFGFGSKGIGYGDSGACSEADGGGGGGGGWYGGAGGIHGGCNSGSGSAGGGSGYIYNSASESSYPAGRLVNSKYYLTNARMYQYSTGCTSSTATATYTVCTSSTGHAVANSANTGNGYARITYLGT